MAIRYNLPRETAVDKILTAFDSYLDSAIDSKEKDKDRAEGARRFNAEMSANADARRQQQLNFNEQQRLEKDKLTFSRERVQKQDDADMDQNIISSLDKVGNLNQQITRANKLLPTMRTEAGKTGLQGIVNSAQNTMESRTAMLDSLLEVELIQPNEYNVMKNNIGSAGYNNMNTQIVNQAIKQSNLESNRGWLTNMEELKGINTQLVVESKNIGTAIYATEKAQQQLKDNIEILNTRKTELLKEMKVGSQTNREDITPGTVTLAGGGTISGSYYDSFVQGTSDDLPLSVWTTLEVEDIEDLEQRRQSYASGVQTKLDEQIAKNPKLTKKEQAILRKAEADEKKKAIMAGEGIDMTGRSTLEGFLNMMKNLKAGDNPQTPFNPMGN
jgi:hypothetical protein